MKRRMSDAEKQIMDILWGYERAVPTSEILASLPEGKNWKQNTVITLLARLQKKQIVTATRIGKAYHYMPLITEQEYRSRLTHRFIEDVHKGSVSGFLNTLVDSGDLSKEDIEGLMQQFKE